MGRLGEREKGRKGEKGNKEMGKRKKERGYEVTKVRWRENEQMSR